MAIITLTTDFGLKDHFVGVLKGSIYTELPEATIVDISHGISPFNIQECAYILQNSYHNFPKGSIHIVGVDSEATPENKHIAVLVDGHFFISANTGVIGLITSEMKPEKVVELHLPERIQGSFPVMSVFIRVACHIARGGTLEVVGKRYSELKTLREFSPRMAEDGKKITGSVIYIDNYGNVVTNIKKSFFDSYGKDREFELHARSKKIRQIHSNYSGIVNFNGETDKQKNDGDLLALFNSSGYLEIAIYRSNLDTVGGASTLLGLEYRDTIIIDFFD
jgi:S-adenosylmethionine hydrolase